MNCQEFENLISGFLDSELSPEQKESFEAHLGECSSCKALIGEYKALDGIMRESEEFLPDEAYWSGFDARLKEKVDKVPAKKAWWSFIMSFRRPALGWAALTLLILMAFITPALRTVFYSPMSEKTAVEQSTYSPAVESSQPRPAPAPVSLDESVTKEEKTTESSEIDKKMQPSAARRVDMEEDHLTAAGKPSVKREKSASSDKAPKPDSSDGEGVMGMKSKAVGQISPPRVSDGPEKRPCETFLEAKKDNENRPEDITDAVRDMPKGSVACSPVEEDPFYTEKPTARSKEYLSRSEVILIKIVNMKDDSHELGILQNSLKASSYEELVRKDSPLLKEDPRLKKHAGKMRMIADQVLNMGPEGINSLKQQVIQSGLLERTRELKP